MNTQTQEKIANGVNVTRLEETIKAVKKDPAIADFKFRAKSQWTDGGYNEFVIDDFYAAKETMRHKKPFKFACDEPDVLLGTDRGANPVEYVLGALSGCMTTTLAYKAAGEGITIDAISSEYEGDIDLQGLLGTKEDALKGYKEIRVKFKVKGDISEDKVKELVKNSPVYDTLVRPIKIKIDVEKV